MAYLTKGHRQDLLELAETLGFPTQSRRETGVPINSRRETGVPINSRRNPISNDRIPETKIADTKEDRIPVSCYGCGAPGIIRSRCLTCNPFPQKEDALS
ncbi:hypothetical protein TNCT_738001 [Trichonephila clavata]|uniref:Uncharacterized protein n=1 Tax=Trichonephila clavata TaxID=2740835 RepID=A0A8X6J4K5_TRICU|nr:hypothetical protein TNCT_738001 [Trichonephila clavata]